MSKKTSSSRFVLKLISASKPVFLEKVLNEPLQVLREIKGIVPLTFVQFLVDQGNRYDSVLAFSESLNDFGILYIFFVFEFFSLKVQVMYRKFCKF